MLLDNVMRALGFFVTWSIGNFSVELEGVIGGPFFLISSSDIQEARYKQRAPGDRTGHMCKVPENGYDIRQYRWSTGTKIYSTQ